MGVFWEKLSPGLAEWILTQPMFWVATAPLSGTGHVNISPKGGPYFGLTASTPNQFWYLDLTGSGIETLAHLHEPGNGRITISFNAFDGPPKIVRLWGKGVVLEFGSPEYDAFVAKNDIKTVTGMRAIVLVNFHQVGSSCGESVPKMDFVEYRMGLNRFMENRVKSDESGNKKDGIERYWAFKNAYSNDGLPAMKRALATAEIDAVKPSKKMVGPYAEIALKNSHQSRGRTIPTWSLVLAVLLSFFMGIMATIVMQSELGLGKF